MILPSCNEGNSLNPISFTDGHGAVILERLRYQRETGRFCDATLRVGTLNFSAHRNVLAACSPYFDSILKKNFVGKEVVNITCKNTAVFNLLLNYMYTGIVCIDRSSVSDLLTLANNLLITKLKNYCAEYLDRNIDSANCLAIKKLAKKYNLPTVYKTAAEYFDCNINRCLLDTVDLLSYKLVQLQLILNDPRFRDVISADVHLRLATRWASEDIEARFKDFRVLLYTCQMRKVSRQTIDYVMDYAPSMKEPRARLAVLNLINESGADLGKYEVEFHSLMAEVGHTLNISLHSREEGNNEEYDVYMEDEPPVEGERTAREIGGGRERTARGILASDQRAYSISSQEDQPGAGVKLKLKLGGERKEGKRMERKKKKRVTDHGEPGTSAECTIDEDGIDGVYCVSEEAVLYPDADGLDPASVGEDDESENVMGGQAMCVHCRYAADETEDLHRHMALRHDSNTVLVCTLCDEGFEARWSKPFYEHVTAHFPSTDSITCEQCEYSTQEGLQAFLNHRIMHHPNERPFKCLTCGWRCATRTQLWSHERVHTGSASCSCQLCGRAFKRPEALETHKAHHNDRRTHSCVDCGWMSKTESELTSHRAVRHQLDVYTCHITGCDYVSTKKSQLAAHLRTHLAVRAHLCRICGRGFIEKSHVVRHERIHLTEKPFKCESCDYASSRRDKLKEHILKYHNGPTIGTTSAGGKQVQRRRYKRAKELAQAIANHSQSRTVDASLIFRPIESSRDRIEQWHQGLNQAHNHQLQAPRALSVLAPSMQHSSHLPMAPASPGSLSLMNAPLGGGIEDSPMMNPFNGMMGGAGDKDMEMVGLRLHESPLITPVPRSPHNHSDPFAMGNQDESHRPMSLPPYGGQHNWYT